MKYKNQASILEVEMIRIEDGKIDKKRLWCIIYRKWFGWRYFGQGTVKGLTLPRLFSSLNDAILARDEKFTSNQPK